MDLLKSHVAHGLLALGFGLSAAAQAQVQRQAVTSPCGQFTYLTQLQGSVYSLVDLTLNGQQVHKGKPNETTQARQADVTKWVSTQNKFNVNWQFMPEALKNSGYRDTFVVLKLVNNQKATNQVFVNVRDYQNQRKVAFSFSRPPAGNIACDNSQGYVLSFGASIYRTIEWIFQVNGKYYILITTSTQREPLDLRPFLTKGKNEVKLSWYVLSADGRGTYGAQITHSASGKSEVLLKTVVNTPTGTQGSITKVINVP